MTSNGEDSFLAYHPRKTDEDSNTIRGTNGGVIKIPKRIVVKGNNIDLTYRSAKHGSTASSAGGTGTLQSSLTGVPSNIDIDDASVNMNTIVKWVNNGPTDINEIWRSTDNITYTLLATVAGNVTSYTDTASVGGGFFYYKIRSQTNSSYSTFSTIRSVCGTTTLSGATISYPSLVLCYGDLTFSGTGTTTSVSLPILRRCGDFDAHALAVMTTINLDSLVTIGRLYFYDSGLTSLSLPALVTCIRFITDRSPLVSISAPSLRTATTDITVSSSTTLQSINFNSLLTVATDLLLNSTGLLSVSFPALTSCGYMRMDGCVSLSNVLFQSLTIIRETLNISGSSITSLSCPKLVSIGTIGSSYFDFRNCTANLVISMPVLTTVGALSGTGIWADSSTAMRSISLPSLTTSKLLSIRLCTSLSLASFPSLRSVANQNILLDGCALGVGSVDNILVQAVASGQTAGTIGLDSGTNAIPGPAGQAAKTTLLLSVNNFVNTN